MLTTNKSLLENSTNKQIHFNLPKLEKVIEYKKDDKSAINIWNKLKETETFLENIFPSNLREFLEIDKK